MTIGLALLILFLLGYRLAFKRLLILPKSQYCQRCIYNHSGYSGFIVRLLLYANGLDKRLKNFADKRTYWQYFNIKC